MFPNTCPSPAFASLQFKQCTPWLSEFGARSRRVRSAFLPHSKELFTEYLLTALHITVCDMCDGEPRHAKCSDALAPLLSPIPTAVSRGKS